MLSRQPIEKMKDPPFLKSPPANCVDSITRPPPVPPVEGMPAAVQQDQQILKVARPGAQAQAQPKLGTQPDPAAPGPASAERAPRPAQGPSITPPVQLSPLEAARAEVKAMQDRMQAAVMARDVSEMSQYMPRLEDYVQHEQTIEDMCYAAQLRQRHLDQQERTAEAGASQTRAELHTALDQSDIAQIGTLTQTMQNHLSTAREAAQRSATVATELETQLNLYLTGRTAARDAAPKATSKPPPPGWSMEPDPTPACPPRHTLPAPTQQQGDQGSQ